MEDVIVGSNVWIGYGACILRGVSVGDNSVIGTNTVVTNATIDMAGKRKAKLLSIVCGNTTTADMTNILVTATKRHTAE